MREKSAAIPTNENSGTVSVLHKGTEYKPKIKVRQLFLTGGKFTAKEINDRIGFNDARKVISDLRNKEHFKIKDVRLENNCKLYWLEQISQPTLFDQLQGGGTV